MVRMEGLEPPRLAAPEPKSGVSTNFTTSATERRTRFEARHIEGSAHKYQALFNKPSILRPAEKRSGCVVDTFPEVSPAAIELIVIIMLIVVAELFFGSMVNRAVNVALNRIKFKGLPRRLLRRLSKSVAR